MKVTVECGETH